jgi:hypothetical protein
LKGKLNESILTTVEKNAVAGMLRHAMNELLELRPDATDEEEWKIKTNQAISRTLVWLSVPESAKRKS